MTRSERWLLHEEISQFRSIGDACGVMMSRNLRLPVVRDVDMAIRLLRKEFVPPRYAEEVPRVTDTSMAN
jgi:hypothetical protein